MTNQTYVPLVSLKIVRERRLSYGGASTPDAAARLLQRLIGSRDSEHFAVLMLNPSNEVIGASIVAVGGIASVQTTARHVFKAAIVSNAHAVIVSHNHPSGNARPSDDDRKFTALIKEAGLLLGVPVLDHLIVTSDDHFSFNESGAM